MKLFPITLFTFLLPYALCGDTEIHIHHQDGYYWREYSGVIPMDAVPGGVDKSGATTYIGQALHENPNGKLIPGKINRSTKTLYYAWTGDEYPVTKNVKILCSQHPEDFEWIETNITQIQSLDQTHLVMGGYDTSYPLFIGRIHAEGEVAVGKVTIPPPYDAIGYTVGGKAYFVKTTFEVLAYQPRRSYNVNLKCASKIINVNVH